VLRGHLACSQRLVRRAETFKCRSQICLKRHRAIERRSGMLRAWPGDPQKLVPAEASSAGRREVGRREEMLRVPPATRWMEAA
jgi:hypothetical protein